MIAQLGATAAWGASLIALDMEFHLSAWLSALCLIVALWLAAQGFRYWLGRQRRQVEELEILVAAKTAELEASERRTREALRTRSLFFSAVSHELRTPLNAVLGFAQLLARDQGLSARQREYAVGVHRGGEHLLALVNNLLALAKVESGRLDLTETRFDLTAAVNAVGQMMSHRALDKGLQWELLLETPLPRFVWGDEAKLRQVLLNVVVGAVAMTDEGMITLRVGSSGGRTHFTVATSAVPTRSASHRESSSSAEVASVEETWAQFGLGIELSQRFARLMGGSFRLESTREEGSVYILELPLPDAESVSCGREPRIATRLASRDRPLRALVVQRPGLDVRVLPNLLESLGLATREAANLSDCLTTAGEWPPDIVFIDGRLLHRDGLQFLDALRRRGPLESHGCAVVGLTSTEDGDLPMLAGGCDDVLLKPVSSDILAETVRRVTGATFLHSGPPESDVTGLTRTRLPQKLREALIRCLEEGDVHGARALVNDVRTVDAVLADELERRLNIVDLDSIVQLLAVT